VNFFEWLNAGRAVLPFALVLIVCIVAVLLESAVGLLAYVPGGPVLVVGAAFTAGVPRILLLVALATVARVVGDAVLFAFGRRRGAGLDSSPVVRRLGRDRWRDAARVLEQHGPLPALLVRLVPVPRSLVPAIAGSRGLRLAPFVGAGVVASLAWAVLWVLVGVLARASFHVARPYLGLGGAFVLAVLVGIGVVYLMVRALVLRLPDGDSRRVLGDSSAAGMAPHPTGDDTGLVQRLFHEDEWRTIPNIVSAVRILLLPVFGVLLVVHQFWAAIVVLLAVFVSDFVDGFVARRFHQTSNLGAWLDPVADRLTVVFVVAAFAASGIVPWQLVVILLIPDILSGAWAVLSFNGAPDVRVSKVGKVRTALLFVGLFMMLFGEAVPAVTRGLVGVGFAFFVLGVVGHYLAMARNARGLVTLWQRQPAVVAARS
jgi:CDP-diacylglycerol--glycerol-3-phosphate 3-phosphatidyltransferase